MYSKVTTDMHFNEREKEVLKFWQDNDIVNKSFHLRDGAIISPFRRPSHRQRQAPYRPCAYPRHQGSDSPLSDHEGQVCAAHAGWDTHGLR